MSDPKLKKSKLETVQLGNYNTKTRQWVPGLGVDRTGDKQVDGSWIFFEVVCDTQEAAEAEVKRYVESGRAKFTGKQVTLNNGIAHPGNTGDMSKAVRY
ncbi:hypothetical protein [Comamonas testosteroni]|uniref:hypothetical protein n=1 Tax=Comamonas testosteroni TaxID=285 RepID=UPI0005B45FE1|nr:hypothetical protein [Comamonas testosteroni]